MMRRKQGEQRRGEQGIALMLCLFALLLLTSIAAGLMFMANSETSVNSNYRSSLQTYYFAKAGVEEARERMRLGSSAAILPPSGWPSASNPNGVIYILNTQDSSDDPVAPWDGSNRYRDDELCSEPLYSSGGSLLVPTVYGAPCDASSVPPAGSYTSFDSYDPAFGTKGALGYKWVRITPKQNCTSDYGVDGTVRTDCTGGANRTRLVCAYLDSTGEPREELASGAACSNSRTPVYVITSMAASKTGPKRIAQAEVAAFGLQIPGAVTILGTPQNFGPTNYDVHLPINDHSIINGNDNAGAGTSIATSCTAGPSKPGIGTGSTTAYNNIATMLAHPSIYPANYLGLGYGAGPSFLQLTTVDLGTSFSSIAGMQALAQKINEVADVKLTGNYGDLNLGDDTHPQITAINGDYASNAPLQGAGILLVTGNLWMAGNPRFNGIVLVIGKGVVQINNLHGDNDGWLNGGMVVANTIAGPLYRPYFEWLPGGNMNINYDSCWINHLAGHFGYTVIAEREKTY